MILAKIIYRPLSYHYCLKLSVGFGPLKEKLSSFNLLSLNRVKVNKLAHKEGRSLKLFKVLSPPPFWDRGSLTVMNLAKDDNYTTE